MISAGLAIADTPAVWRDLGFTVDDDRTVVDGIVHHLVGDRSPARGIVEWSLAGLPAGVTSLDGLVVEGVDRPEARVDPAHPNGVSAIDHLVVRSPDAGRTAAAFAAAGLDERRRRTTDSAGRSVDMRFFLAETPSAAKFVIELVGPREPDPTDTRPARLWGLAYSCADLDATAAYFGPRCTEPKDAVQPGRRICALSRDVATSVPIAFMSAHIG